MVVSVNALIDSGAQESYINTGFVEQHQVSLVPLNAPIKVMTIDGRVLKGGLVKWQTPPMRMRMGPHEEVISFHVTPIEGHPVILGLRWLAKHDPNLSFHQRTMGFCSQFCMANCLEGQHASPSQLQATIERDNQAAFVPREYHRFSKVFDPKEADRLPPHRDWDCRIELKPGAQLPAPRLYSLSGEERELLKEYIDSNLAKGFIRPTTAAGGSPVFFVDKKGEGEGGQKKKRLVADYRILNSLSYPSKYPMPRIDDLLDCASQGKIFTKLDLKGAYNLIRVREGDEWKTTICTPLGAFEYLVMPFGLQGSAGCFQGLMNYVLAPVLFKNTVCYIDDILIYSRNLEEHVKDVTRVLDLLQQNGLYANLDKCEFHVREVEFLGYILSDKGIAMDKNKVDAVLSWAPPKTKRDVQSFLGFANFYRKFIKGFADLTTPISDCLKGKRPFQWTPEAQQSFEKLKKAFACEQNLLHVNPQRPIRIETDASDRAIAGVLLQQDNDGDWCPCAYFSRKLNPSECNYSTWDKELLAIVAAFKNWRHFLVGAKDQVKVCTDHKNLEYWRKARLLNQRQARWATFLADFNFVIEYVPGVQNGRADALSRKPEFMEGFGKVPPSALLGEDCWVRATQTVADQQQWIRDTEQDPFAKRVCRELQEDRSRRPGFEVRNRLLYHKGALYVPQGGLRQSVLQQCHDTPTAGHFGKHKTLHLVAKEFWWPGMREEVAGYVRSCDACQRAKTERRRPAGLLEPLPVPSRPWEVVGLDFITDLPPSKRMTCILVVVDLFSRMAHFIPCTKEVSASETAKLFIQHVFRLHGWPEKVVSDRGAVFTSGFWRRLMELLQVQVCLTSARHPQSNGCVERINGVVQQYLRCFVSEKQSAWVDHLPLAEFAYNNSRHSGTGMSPFEAIYGAAPQSFPGSGVVGEVPAADQLAEELQVIHEDLRENLRHAQESYKRWEDRHRREGESIEVGDLVWLSTKGLPMRGGNKKLVARRIGPFRVEKIINPVAFKLKLPEEMKIHPVFHRSLLSKYWPPHQYQREAEQGGQQVEVEDEEPRVHEILDSRWRGNRLEYLVSWEDQPSSENAWVSPAQIGNRILLEEFHALFPEKPQHALWSKRDLFDSDSESDSEFIGFPADENEEKEEEVLYTSGEESEGEEEYDALEHNTWESLFDTTSSGEEFRGFNSSEHSDEGEGVEGGFEGGMDVRDSYDSQENVAAEFSSSPSQQTPQTLSIPEETTRDVNNAAPFSKQHISQENKDNQTSDKDSSSSSPHPPPVWERKRGRRQSQSQQRRSRGSGLPKGIYLSRKQSSNLRRAPPIQKGTDTSSS